ncbi:3-deoxy-D-manno-octulosonic acid transferase [Acinetobacter guerrae]|uniref:3-deoxy-D-manno-octulosonic acid transferase n=1 Tax=Acinetobacter guerrae TaxID=1843371 RepID=UPI00128B1D91|nr:3-deoxy-D-manno-octulosonic acid transferase [Acinetobacter guerrae]MPW45508.1 3-deoxy-D-manno-2-octulosonate transferase [Acinetobacter guerrae]
MATPFWYNFLLACIKPFYRWKIKQRAETDALYQQECLERFGPFQPVKNRHALWFHAVSVGETNAAQPLIEHYLKLGYPVLVTNTTKTGQARAKSLFLKQPYLDLFQAVYLPVDQIDLLQQFFAKYQPRFLALVETELWPNLIDQAKQHQIAIMLLNARLSEKSAKGYAKVAGLTKAMLSKMDCLLAQDLSTQQRYIELGLKAEKTEVVGNIKFDISAPRHFLEQAEQLKQQWRLQERQIITLASTHAPEEQLLLEALLEDLKNNPALMCIIVPRHPERFDEVFQLCQKLNLNTQRRSLGQSIQPDSQVYLADSMGELWLWYALSQVCFVGGSLNEPGGGHNILEPMALDVPTVIGPRYFNFQNIVDQCTAEQAIDIVSDAISAAVAFRHYLYDQVAAKHMATQAQQFLARNQGSLQRHISVIDQYLDQQAADE